MSLCGTFQIQPIILGLNPKSALSAIVTFGHIMSFLSFIYLFIYLCIVLFMYSHVHTSFGSFLHPAPLPHLVSLPPSVPGRSRSALITDFVEEKT
jgi:hypothetical protein